jgi:hypothetical protein
MDGVETCQACRRSVEPWQEYCLECGARILRPHGVVAFLGRWWRRRLPGYPGDWIWPALGALVIAVAGTAAALSATGGTGRAAPQTLTALSELVEPSTTVAERPRARRVIAWPRQNGYTIALAIYPVADGGGVARDRAARALKAGLPQVGILLSSNFASLHPGYYIVFTGIYASRDDAEAALPAASRRFPNAAVRSVVR